MNDSKKSKNFVKHLITSMIDKETREWPPHCVSLLYQPVRPVSNWKSGASIEPGINNAKSSGNETDETV